MSRRVHVLLAVMAFLLSAAPRAHAQQQSLLNPGAEAPAVELLSSAESKFDAAVRRLRSDRVLTPALFREAASTYSAIAARGINNTRLYLNAGNAWLLAGDAGHAVLAYRRAERLRPADLTVQKSLANARAQVGIALAPSAQHRMVSALTAWRGWIPRSRTLTVTLAAYSLLWLLAALRWTPWRRVARPTLGWFLALTALGGTVMLLVDDRMSRSTREGVVVAPAGADARNGPSNGVYDPTFDQPLPPGVEVRILEERLGWLRVELIDGRETWIEADTVERVQP